MPKEKSISVVIPAYNEEANIATTILSLYQFLESRVSEFELIVVDDGSRDKTFQEAEGALKGGRGNPLRLRVIQHPVNRGYGGALRTGFYSARNNWILLFPGDAQFKVDEIDMLLSEARKIKNKQPFVVWPYRSQRAEGFHRALNAFLYRCLIRLVLGVHVRDIDCGMKLYHRDVFYKLPKLTSEGALIDAEIMTHCCKLGIPFLQVPVTHLPRGAGTPTGNNFKTITNMFRELRQFKRQLKNFMNQ